MANKRMFSMNILDSDAFLDMPLSSQALYLHLNMRADDDGFISNPKRIQRLIGSSDDDLKLLLAKRFLLAFEDGVMVIKHWRMHNTIRADRYTPTAYQDELSRLLIKENKSYSLNEGKPIKNRLPSGCQEVIPAGTTGLGLGLGLGTDTGQGEEEETTGCSSSQFQLTDVFKTYENEIGLLSPTVSETFISYENEISTELMIIAIKKAAKANARRLSYIEGIMKNWVIDNIKNADDLKAKEKEQKASNNRSNSKVDRFNEMDSRDIDFDEIERLERARLDKILEDQNGRG